MFDEFIITKGTTPYTDTFTPPEDSYDMAGDVVLSQNEGTQETPFLVKQADFFDLYAGDFCIQVDFDIRSLFQWVTYTNGTPNFTTKTYIIVGQWDQNPDGTVKDNANYWVLFFRVNADYTTDVVFKVVQNGVVITEISHPVTIDWSAAWANGEKSNLSSVYTNIVVSRQGASDRIFVGGLWSDSPNGQGTLTGTLTPIAGDVQINGQIGAPDDFQPTSITSVNNLRIFDYAYYWNPFVPEGVGGYPGIPWYQLSGLAFYPRMNSYLMYGKPGDIRSELPINLRMRGSLYDYSYSEITALLPIPFSMQGSLYFGNIETGEFNITIPMLTGDSLEMYWGFFEGMNSEESGANGMTNGMTLPMLQFLGDGQTDEVAQIDVSIPFMSFSGEGMDSELGELNVSIPMLQFLFVTSNDEAGQINASLPSLLGALAGVDEITGVISVVLPAMKIYSETLDGESGELNVSLPFFKALFSGLDSIEGILGIKIPLMKMSLFATTFTDGVEDTDSFTALVMNVKNKGLTEFKNYGFNSFCNFVGRNVGALSDGIYELAGDKDVNDEISWNFRTGAIHLEMKSKKRLKQAWFSYKSNGDLMVTIVLASGESYEYDVEGYTETLDGGRVKIGKGIRTKYLMFDVKNIEGSTINLDAIRLHYDLIKKKR